MNHKLINNSFYNLKKYLEKFSIYLESKIPDSTILKGINSLELADKNNLSFYCDYKLLPYLKSSNAFGCSICKLVTTPLSTIMAYRCDRTPPKDAVSMLKPNALL